MIHEKGKLGLTGLVGIVFGSVIGGSIFNIAQNMSCHSSLGAVLLSWLITGCGVLVLVLTLKRLADTKPELQAGIYQYAQEGFGEYVGFNMAWGYWLCVIFGNVTYSVLLNDSIGAFFPSLLSHGWETVLFGWFTIWLMYWIVARGIKSASIVNVALSVLKFLCLALIIVVLMIGVRIGMFTSDFWGHGSGLGSVSGQIESCMLVTVWSFLGIEGAVTMSSRAKKMRDVGRATVIGFILALLLYVLVTALCYGVMTQPEIASLPNPSLAYALEKCAGDWAKWFVIISVIVSVGGGFVAWSLMLAQTPYEAALVKILPRQFLRLNRKGVPSFGLVLSSGVMSVYLLLLVTASDVYLASVNMAALMALPPYLFCGMYLLKQIINGKERGGLWSVVSLLTVAYCGYTIYAAGLELMLVTSLFYLAGTPFFIVARRQNASGERVFTPVEKGVLLGLILTGVLSIYLLMSGGIQL